MCRQTALEYHACCACPIYLKRNLNDDRFPGSKRDKEKRKRWTKKGWTWMRWFYMDEGYIATSRI